MGSGDTVSTGAFSGQSYATVVQDAIDYQAFGQYDFAIHRGGWGYVANQNYTEQYSILWTVAGLNEADQWGLTVPAFVVNELNNDYVRRVQYMSGGPNQGGSGWGTSAMSWINSASTGVLLEEMALAGRVAGDANVNAALGYVDNFWRTTVSGWNGNFGNSYAMWAQYQGLSEAIGTADTTYITNFMYPGASLDPGDSMTWYEDYHEYIVNAQSGNGSWLQAGFLNNYMTTALYLDILEAEALEAIPEPMSVIFFSTGLAGVLGFLARRKMRRVSSHA